MAQMKQLTAYKQGMSWQMTWENKQGYQTKPAPYTVETAPQLMKHISEHMTDKYFVEIAQSDLVTALKEMRVERGLSQIKAANEIGISLATVSGIEQGKVPGADTADKINQWINK